MLLTEMEVEFEALEMEGGSIKDLFNYRVALGSWLKFLIDKRIERGTLSRGRE